MEEREVGQAYTRTSQTLIPPPPIYTISNQRDTSIQISRTETHLVIGVGSDINLEPRDKFRALLLINCDNCQIVTLTKLLKLQLVDCRGGELKVEGGIIGALDLLRCHNLRVKIGTTIPYVEISLSSYLVLDQRSSEQIYSIGTSIYIYHRTQEQGTRAFPGTVFEHDRRVVYATRSGVWETFCVSHPLNSVSHHLWIDLDQKQV